MKKSRFVFLIVCMSVKLVWPEVTPAGDSQQRDQARKLPEIQLQEYTIVGLEKVVLPHKERHAVFKDIPVKWVENTSLQEKASSKIDFQFSRRRSLRVRLNEFPRLSTTALYGSFNTLALDVKTQLRVSNILPYVAVNRVQSDGHEARERAKWSRNFFQGGIQAHAWEDGLVSLGTRYLWKKQHLWGRSFPIGRDREVVTTFWQWNALFRQRWGQRIATFIKGQYHLNKQQSAFNYQQRRFSTSLGLRFRHRETSVYLEATYEYHNSKRLDGRIVPLDSAGLITLPGNQWVNKERLISGSFNVTRRIKEISFTAGVRVQGLRQDFENVRNRTDYFPFAELAINSSNMIYLKVRYHPGFQFSDLPELVERFPFADLDGFRTTRVFRHVVGELAFTPSKCLGLRFASTFIRGESFPVLYSINFPENGVTKSPYWSYAYLPEVKRWIHSAWLRFQPRKRLVTEAWVTFQSSEILKGLPEIGDFVGHEVPYLPPVSSSIKLRWVFARYSNLELVGEYAGKRYHDLNNSIQLGSYFVLNAHFRVGFSKHVLFEVYGENLMDRKYEAFFTFPAPPIRGGTRLGIKL